VQACHGADASTSVQYAALLDVGPRDEAAIFADATGWRLTWRVIADDKPVRGFHANRATVAQGMVGRDGSLDEKPYDSVSAATPSRLTKNQEGCDVRAHHSNCGAVSSDRRGYTRRHHFSVGWKIQNFGSM
jgi:hypothetical protein